MRSNKKYKITELAGVIADQTLPMELYLIILR